MYRSAVLRRGLVLVFTLAISGIAIAADNVITIQGVYLKNDAGEWVKIIEPDRRVDLEKEEPVVSFFNNTGRVPSGSYKNFRVDFYGEDLSRMKKFSSKNDFEKSVEVKKGSFVHVSFDLALEPLAIRRADLTVGEDNREFLSDSILLEA